jgi:SAM-dependent methyltransferase
LTVKETIKALLGPKAMLRIRAARKGFELPEWGNLRRRRPFSSNFGSERGLPVDRVYLHRFLERHKGEIRGDVLEIQGSGYTKRFGVDLRSHKSIDINAAMKPDYLCDLAEADRMIAAESFDCFLMPQTLQHLERLEESLRQAFRLLRPGGVILASAAGLLPLIPDAPDRDFWRFSAAGWNVLLNRVWQGAEREVRAHGTCLTATAAMMGLAAEDLSPADFEEDDPRYPVLVTIFCRKPR